MKKNVAGQVVGAEMINATTGAAFTGAVTVSVTGDGGTQATGSVGSGACTHEGNGFHTYAPAQAETNYDHVAFTFTGTGAIPATVQVYPSFPQTGDNFARLGAPVGASISADVAAVQADTDNLQTRIPAALVSGRIDASVGAMAANVLTATAINADAITAAKIADGAIDAATFAAGAINAAAIAADAITDAKVASDVTIASVTGAVGSVTGAVGSVTGNVGGNVTGSVGSVATGGITAASLAADAITAAKLHADVTTELQSGLATAAALATAKTVIDAIDAKTANLPSDPADQSLIIAATNAVIADTEDIQARLPAALTAAGNLKADVEEWRAEAPSTLEDGNVKADVILVDHVNATTKIAGIVWDAETADHDTAGTTGKALTDAGSAGDPWSTALPGAYGSGTAGKIVGDNVNATISSRSSHSAADVWAVGTRTLTSFGTLVADAAAAVWAAATRTLTAFGFMVDADVVAVDGSAAAAAQQRLALLSMLTATVSGSPSPTSVPASDLPAGLDNDNLKGRIVVFLGNTTAEIQAQATDITAYNGTTKTLTVTALTRAPAVGDIFVIF